MLTLPGYEDQDTPLTDGSGYLSRPLFWPCHLGSSLRDEHTQAVAFGPDWDDALALIREIHSPDAWPVFTVHLHAGHVLHVVYTNVEGDGGTDYLLSHPDRPEPVTLAADNGHFTGPGLSWPELEAAAGLRTASGVTDPDARLLLLFPMLGDTEIPRGAAPRLAAALRALTIVEDPAELARLLLLHQGQWSPANWYEADGTRICDGSHSHRNPANDFALSPAQRAAATQAFGASAPAR
ncbi:hypothetical protein ACIQUQ_32090 [Streptomyces sp. NPDC101118]|uniref:hypothetical protein n=1 Tax=Streptomyces sp. NPDC101118 TaxID=3366109 RepID=UPI0037F7D122